jgi:hypothetical protein
MATWLGLGSSEEVCAVVLNIKFIVVKVKDHIKLGHGLSSSVTTLSIAADVYMRIDLKLQLWSRLLTWANKGEKYKCLRLYGYSGSIIWVIQWHTLFTGVLGDWMTAQETVFSFQKNTPAEQVQFCVRLHNDPNFSDDGSGKISSLVLEYLWHYPFWRLDKWLQVLYHVNLLSDFLCTVTEILLILSGKLSEQTYSYVHDIEVSAFSFVKAGLAIASALVTLGNPRKVSIDPTAKGDTKCKSRKSSSQHPENCL